jgi:hypothetical protein
LRTFFPHSKSVRPEFIEGLFTATKGEERFDQLNANGIKKTEKKG